jgi:hypothetical protein
MPLRPVATLFSESYAVILSGCTAPLPLGGHLAARLPETVSIGAVYPSQKCIVNQSQLSGR